MLSIRRMLQIAICLTIPATVTPAHAQPASDSNISFSAPGFLPKKPKPGLPDVQAQPLAWPRLDPGAVLCRSEADLDRLAERRRGETVNEPIECQIVRVATAISIVQRRGPGRAEVRTSDPGAAAGWTDAWLPEKAPTRATPVSR